MEVLLAPSIADKGHSICMKLYPLIFCSLLFDSNTLGTDIEGKSPRVSGCVHVKIVSKEVLKPCAVESGYCRDSNLVKAQRTGVHGVFGHKWGIYMIYTSAKTQETLCGRVGGKTVKARGLGDWGKPVSSEHVGTAVFTNFQLLCLPE